MNFLSRNICPRARYIGSVSSKRQRPGERRGGFSAKDCDEHRKPMRADGFRDDATDAVENPWIGNDTIAVTLLSFREIVHFRKYEL